MSDKAEILSDAEVDFLLAAETSAEPGAAPAPVDEQAVTMRGDLDQINLADIFQTLSMAKMEGVLRVRNPLEERQIHVRDGYLRAHVPARLATRRHRRVGAIKWSKRVGVPDTKRGEMQQQRDQQSSPSRRGLLPA